MSQNEADRLEQSWLENASGWTAAVRDRQIESRRVATDQAILSAVLEREPRRVLDVGCGEGWLCRALHAAGVEAVGIDGSAPLVDAARSAAPGEYRVLRYHDLVAAPPELGSFDAIVCNFSLLAESIAPQLSALRAMLRPAGALLVQTVHPWTASAGGDYTDGWRTENFSGFGGQFPEPMPWFFRTLESWSGALADAGYRIQNLREPLHPETLRPLALLLVAIPAPAPPSHGSR